MKALLFTKPKKMTLECLKFLMEQKEELLGVVVWNTMQHKDSEFFKYCVENDIRIIDGAEIYNYLDEFKNNLDIIYVNTYPKLLKDDIIKLASKGAINFHPGPLPEYRGPFPYNFAIYNEEEEYGVTVHRLSNEFDTGDIIEVDRFAIDVKNITVRKLADISEMHILELFKKTYYRLVGNEIIEYSKQKEGHYYSRRDFENLKRVQDTDSAEVIRKKIKAFWCPPFEGAYVEINGVKYTIVDENVLKGL